MIILTNIFLIDRRSKMGRKIAIIIPVFFLCLGLYNCMSPGNPDNSKSQRYRYNVEVIYSDVAEGESDFPLFLYYSLEDDWGVTKSGYSQMTKIGENKARAHIPKVRIHTSDSFKHSVSVVDPNKEPWCHRGENIDVQGAYDLEISTTCYCSCLLFRMSGD
jgi:hypothetical protein